MKPEEPDDLRAGHILITGDWKICYRDNTNVLEISKLDFETPTSRGTISGVLAPKDTSLDVHLEVGALENWNDFIHALSGDKPGSDDAKIEYTGSLQWDGTIAGPSDGPTFQGHFRGENVRYGNVVLDSLDGDMSYSPRALTISHGRATHGTMQAGIDGELQLNDWEFRPDSKWTSEIQLEKVPLDGSEQLAGWRYPVHGLDGTIPRTRDTRRTSADWEFLDLANGMCTA
jgi:hypothetical protein